MASVLIKNYTFPEGYQFTIPGLGGFSNFELREVDETQVAEYMSLGYTWPEDGNLVITIKDPPDEIEVEEVEEPEVEEAAPLVYRDPESDEPTPVVLEKEGDPVGPVPQDAIPTEEDDE